MNSQSKAIFWIICWSVTFTLAMTLAKYVSSGIPTIVFLFLRYSFGFLFLVPLAFKERKHLLPLKAPKQLLLRSVFSMISTYCTYYAYRHLPLATASAIGFSAPFFTVILAAFILKEKISLQKAVALVIGYAGVLLIVRPFSLTLHPALLVSLLANLFASATIVTTKDLTSKENSFAIMFYSSGFMMLAAAVGALFDWYLPPAKDVALLSLVGCCGLASQYFYLKALKGAEPSFLAPFEYSRLVFALLAGFCLFQEVPTLMVGMGALVIIASNYYIGRYTVKASNPLPIK